MDYAIVNNKCLRSATTTDPTFFRIVFLLRPPTMLTCPSSGMQPEFRSYPINELVLVGLEVEHRLQLRAWQQALLLIHKFSPMPVDPRGDMVSSQSR